jgi:transposase-like protein
MAVIPDFKGTTLLAFLKQNVPPGSTVYTDGLKSFTGLQEAGFQHMPRIQPLRGDLRKGAKSVVPLADRAIGNLQQWADRNSSWRQPRSTPGLSRRICLSAQSPQAAHGCIPRLCLASERAVIQRLTIRYVAQPICLHTEAQSIGVC